MTRQHPQRWLDFFRTNRSTSAGNEKHTPNEIRSPESPQISCLCRYQVVARDDDQGANGQLSYVLSGGNDDSAFSLSSSGQLSLTQTVDREARGKYVLLITAADSGTTAILDCVYEDLVAFGYLFSRVLAESAALSVLTWPVLSSGLNGHIL